MSETRQMRLRPPEASRKFRDVEKRRGEIGMTAGSSRGRTQKLGGVP